MNKRLRRRILLQAAEMIDGGDDKFSCRALQFAGHENKAIPSDITKLNQDYRDLFLYPEDPRRRVGDFFLDKIQQTHWYTNQNRYQNNLIVSEDSRQHRVMMLLLAREVL